MQEQSRARQRRQALHGAAMARFRRIAQVAATRGVRQAMGQQTSLDVEQDGRPGVLWAMGLEAVTVAGSDHAWPPRRRSRAAHGRVGSGHAPLLGRSRDSLERRSHEAEWSSILATATVGFGVLQYARVEQLERIFFSQRNPTPDAKPTRNERTHETSGRQGNREAGTREHSSAPAREGTTAHAPLPCPAAQSGLSKS